MTFPFNVYCLAMLVAAITAGASLPLWRRWCLRTGLVDDPGHRKIHHTPIPLAGGMAVLGGVLLPLVLGALVLWANSWGNSAGALLSYGYSRRATQLAAIAIGAIGMWLLGYFDDRIEFQPARKFAGQLFIALMVAAAGVRITLFVHNIFFSYLVTVLWILTVTNAFNFMDNMNGLCAGVGAIGAWYFGLVAASSGQYLVALLAFLAFGALLGFLPYNFPRATAFLGDSGSHLVGYLLAVLAILPHFYTSTHPRKFAVLDPLFVLAVPLLDLISVVTLRWKIGQPFYVGDTNHLSHRLVRRGLSATLAVIVIWAMAAILGAIALILK
jgi:UDP-GlcNAc:undecaprenyl-phosphate GlcNAc-1-phosphate transferase